MKSIPMSRSEVDALRKDECLQLMEHLGEAQPRRGVLVVELKSMIKDLLFSKERGQEKPLLGFAKVNRNQLAEKARQLQIPVSEHHTRGHFDQDHKGRPDTAINTEGLGLPGFSSTEPRRIRKFYIWITITTCGSNKWRIINPTGNSRDSRRG